MRLRRALVAYMAPILIGVIPFATVAGAGVVAWSSRSVSAAACPP